MNSEILTIQRPQKASAVRFYEAFRVSEGWCKADVFFWSRYFMDDHFTDDPR